MHAASGLFWSFRSPKKPSALRCFVRRRQVPQWAQLQTVEYNCYSPDWVRGRFSELAQQALKTLESIRYFVLRLPAARQAATLSVLLLALFQGGLRSVCHDSHIFKCKTCTMVRCIEHSPHIFVYRTQVHSECTANGWE